jgi:hypothetical protein
MSATQSRSGAAGRKLRLTTSLACSAAGSAMVVRLTFPRTAPRSHSARMTRSTLHRATGIPSRLSCSQTLRAPYTE